jgi:hypothetical protein
MAVTAPVAEKETTAEDQVQTWYLTVMGDGTWSTRDEERQLKKFQGGPHEVDDFIAARAQDALRRNKKIRIGHKPVRHPGKPDQRGMLTREDVGWLDKDEDRTEGRAADRWAKEEFKLDPNRELGISYPCPHDGCVDLEGNQTEYVAEAALERHLQMNHEEGNEDASQ